MTFHGISQYVRSIIRPLQGCNDGKYSELYSVTVDFVYLTCGHGIYVIRPDQKQSTFIQTTSVDEMIEASNKKHKQPDKNMTFAPKSEGEEVLVIKNFIDCR